MRLPVSLAAVATVLLIALFGAVVMVGAANLRSQASDDVTINGPAVTCIPVTPTPLVTARPTRTPPGSHFLGTGLTIQGEFCANPPHRVAVAEPFAVAVAHGHANRRAGDAPADTDADSFGGALNVRGAFS